MAVRKSRTNDHIRLSREAVLAAERLAAISGLPAADLLEVVLLELVESGLSVEAGLSRNPPIVRHSELPGGPGPAKVIPIGHGRPGRAPGAGLRRRTRRRRAGVMREPGECLPRGGATSVRDGDGDD